MEKGKRSANVTEREKEFLISLVQKNLHIIENKKTNAVYNKQKNECWEKLAWDFNANQTSGLRTGLQLRSTYEQMKKNAKQHKAQDKVELHKTGGGKFTENTTYLDSKILGLLEENYFSIENRFDSNSTVIEPGPSNYNKEEENIIFIVDEGTGEDSCSIDTFPVSIRADSPLQNVDENNMNSINNDAHETVEPPKKKQKLVSNIIKAPGINQIRRSPATNQTLRSPATNQTRRSHASVLLNKKCEVLKKKMDILNLVKESEIETMKGKKLDNEIKEIVKERNIIELKIKQAEYEKLLLNQ